MYATSVTWGYATTESRRPNRITRTTPEGTVRTRRVRQGRANQRRRAIAESWDNHR